MADDSELAAIRQQRLLEMQQGSRGDSNSDKQKQQEEARAQMEDMKNNILSQVLSQDARARLNTVAAAKPEKAKMIEGMICQMAQTGQIRSKLSEGQLKDLLEQVSERTKTNIKVKYDRRRTKFDDDDDDEF